MRASVLQGPRTVVLSADVPTPEPTGSDVLVRIDGAGICASELPLWEGRDWFDYPRQPGEPGHEGWGRIAACGPDVIKLRPGERVALIGERAHAEYALVDDAHVVRIPDALDPTMPFPGEPLACAVNAMRRAEIASGQRVAVVGCGFLGLLLVQLARAAGADVIAVSRRASSLDMARGVGAVEAWREDDDALLRRHDGACDVVFEAAGYQAPLDLAAQLCRVRGRLMIVGYHQDGRRSVDMQLWNWRGLDVVNAHERDPEIYVRGLRDAIDAVIATHLDPRPLLTHRFTLDELGDAYQVSCERPEGFIKAVWVDG